MRERQVIPDATTATLDFLPQGLGVYRFTFTVSDDDVGVSSDEVVVTVKNKPAQVVLDPVPMIFENQGANLAGRFIDPDPEDGHVLVIDWGDPNNSVDSRFVVDATQNLVLDKTFVSTTGDGAGLVISGINLATGVVGFRVERQYKDDGPAPGNSRPSDVSLIQATIADIQGGSGPPEDFTNSSNTTVTVTNVQPVLSGISVTPTVDEAGTVTLTGTVTNPGTLDQITLSISWGDALSPGSGRLRHAGHIFSGYPASFS